MLTCRSRGNDTRITRLRSAGMCAMIVVSDRAPGSSFAVPTPSAADAPARVSEPTSRKFWSPLCLATSLMEAEFGSSAAMDGGPQIVVAPQAMPSVRNTVSEAAIATAITIRFVRRLRCFFFHSIRDWPSRPSTKSNGMSVPSSGSRRLPSSQEYFLRRAASSAAISSWTAENRASVASISLMSFLRTSASSSKSSNSSSSWRSGAATMAVSSASATGGATGLAMVVLSSCFGRATTDVISACLGRWSACFGGVTSAVFSACGGFAGTAGCWAVASRSSSTAGGVGRAGRGARRGGLAGAASPVSAWVIRVDSAADRSPPVRAGGSAGALLRADRSNVAPLRPAGGSGGALLRAAVPPAKAAAAPPGLGRARPAGPSGAGRAGPSAGARRCPCSGSPFGV